MESQILSQRQRKKNYRASFACFAACFLFISAPTVSQEISGEEDARATLSSGGNLYLAGSTVRTKDNVAGDLIAAGGSVTVDKSVGQDAVVAGGDVLIEASIGQDVRAAGGQLIIRGDIGGEAIAAGGKVNLTRDSTVGGDAWLSGGEVLVEGTIGRELRVYANKVSIDGEVKGEARLTGRKIKLSPGAVIHGSLIYTSPNEIEIAPGAKITGNVLREPISERWVTKEQWRGFSLFLRVLWLAGLITVGALFLLLFPDLTRRAEASMRASPLKSLGIGSAILFASPPIIIILFISIIGIPLALALIAAYAILLLLGYLTTATYIGDHLAQFVRKGAALTIGWRIAAMAIAILLLALVRSIPFAGGFITLIALLFGLGAFVLQLFRRYTTQT